MLIGQDLRRGALQDLLGCSVVCQGYTFGHSLMSFWGLLEDKVIITPFVTQLDSNLHVFQLQGTPGVYSCLNVESSIAQFSSWSHKVFHLGLSDLLL